MFDEKIDSYSQLILGCFLRNHGILLESDVHEADFIDEYRVIFVAMKKIVSSGHEIDLFRLSEDLGDTSIFRFIRQINEKDVACSTKNAQRLIDALREMVNKKRLLQIFVNAASKIEQDSDSKCVEVLSYVMRQATDVINRNKRQSYTAAEMAAHLIDDIERTSENKANGTQLGFSTGINKIDTHMGGYRAGDIIIIAGRPAMGKTALAISNMIACAKAGKKCGFISTEMTLTQVGERFAAQIASIDSYKLRTGDLDNNDYDAMTYAVSVMKDLPVVINDTSVMTVMDIRMQAQVWLSTCGLDILFIDYLTRLASGKPRERNSLEVGDIVTELKSLAKDFQIPVVLLAQLNRDVESRADKRPYASDLKESGRIEEEADVVMLLYRPSVYFDKCPDTGRLLSDDEAEVIIGKNRHGPSCDYRVKFNPSTMKWSDP